MNVDETKTNATSDPTTPEPTEGAMRDALPELCEPVNGRISPETLRALLPAVFAPAEPERHPNERFDLARFICELGRRSGGDLRLDLLAMLVNHTALADEPAYVQRASLDLLRAIAVFAVREAAFYLALPDEAIGGAA